MWHGPAVWVVIPSTRIVAIWLSTYVRIEVWKGRYGIWVVLGGIEIDCGGCCGGCDAPCA